MKKTLYKNKSILKISIILLIMIMFGSLFAFKINASSPAASATVSGNVFIGNSKMEIGINPYGSFGSTANAPSNFHPWTGASQKIGLRSDPAINARDYFLPGTVDEGFVFAWSSSSNTSASQKAYVRSNYVGSVINSYVTSASTVDQSTGTSFKAVTTLTAATNLAYTQKVSVEGESGVARVEIELKNLSTTTLYNVEYIRGFDPDQVTSNTNNYYYTDEDGIVWVIASSNSSPKGNVSFETFTTNATYPFIFMAQPSNYYTVTPVSQRVGWSSYSDFIDVTSTSNTRQLNYSNYEDRGIGLRFKVPQLIANQEITLSYYMSLESDIDDALTILMNGNLGTQPQSFVAEQNNVVELCADINTLFPNAPSTLTYTFQWQKCETETGTYTDISGANLVNYSAPTDTIGETFYQCIISPSVGTPLTTGLARVTVIEA